MDRTGPPLLFGLAPRGVYRASGVATRAVGSYPTVSPLPFASHGWGAPRGFASGCSQGGKRRRSALCCTIRGPVEQAFLPVLRCPLVLPGALSCGVRTFLQPRQSGTSGRPAHSLTSSIRRSRPSEVTSGSWRHGQETEENPLESSSGGGTDGQSPRLLSLLTTHHSPVLLSCPPKSASSRRLPAAGRGIRAPRSGFAGGFPPRTGRAIRARCRTAVPRRIPHLRGHALRIPRR